MTIAPDTTLTRDEADAKLWIDIHLSDEAECEASERVHYTRACTVVATHRVFTRCGANPGGVLWCENRHQAYLSALHRPRPGRVVCGHCRKPIRDCWTVLPV